MRKKLKCIALFLMILMLPSCHSIYDDQPEITQEFSMEIDPNEEYFTLGNAVSRNDNNGRIYNDSWIYPETQTYQKYVKTYDNGEEKWATRSIQRWVKVNSKTGQVSSLCLVPDCNHGPDSGCIMIAPQGTVPLLQGITGDWLVFSYYYRDNYKADSLGFIPESYVYNLQTGETIQIAEYDLSGSTISTISAWCFFENKIYYAKQVLDYTDTDYVPGKVLDDYIPETTSYLTEFNIETKKLTDVIEIPNDYKIAAITNKRFFFSDSKKDIYSCDHQGNNMTKEGVLDFAPQDFCGIFAYDFSNIEDGELLVYNIRTDTKTVIQTDYSYREAYLTNEGILLNTFSTSNEEYHELWERKDELFKTTREYTSARNKHRYEATALVYLLNFDGSDPQLIYDKENIILRAYLKSDKYLCAINTAIDPKNDYYPVASPNKGRVLINIETKEMIPVPYLELVLPDGCRPAE